MLHSRAQMPVDLDAKESPLSSAICRTVILSIGMVSESASSVSANISFDERFLICGMYLTPIRIYYIKNANKSQPIAQPPVA